MSTKAQPAGDEGTASVSATELHRKTGKVLHLVRSGHRVEITLGPWKDAVAVLVPPGKDAALCGLSQYSATWFRSIRVRERRSRRTRSCTCPRPRR